MQDLDLFSAMASENNVISNTQSIFLNTINSKKLVTGHKSGQRLAFCCHQYLPVKLTPYQELITFTFIRT